MSATLTISLAAATAIAQAKFGPGATTAQILAVAKAAAPFGVSK